MLEFIGFIISITLVSASSLFLTSLLKEKKASHNLLYLALLLISQVIVTFELLNLFKYINTFSLLTLNALFFAGAFGLWVFKKRPLPDFSAIQKTAGQVYTAIKSDKILLILACLFGFSLVIILFFVIYVPTNQMDSHCYRLARPALWVQNGFWGGYETTDLRLAVFPINWEIMLTWTYIFFRTDYFSIFPAFFSYLGSLGVIGLFLNDLKLSLRRIIWVILILSSLPIMIIMASGTINDIFVGFLLVTSFYLFRYAVKNKKERPLIFSAAAYAIALGSKSTAILYIPVFGIVFLLICFMEKSFKPLGKFIMYCFAAFMVLSAYIYILNLLEYGFITGPKTFTDDHTNIGPVTFLSSAILYLANLADFSGIPLVEPLNPDLTAFMADLSRNLPLSYYEGLNCRILENYSSWGILGYLLFVPMIIYTCDKINSKSDRTFYLSICGYFMAGFFLVLSLILGFSVWNMRFFVPAMILCSPVIAFSYSRKPGFYKVLIAVAVAFNFIVATLFNEQKPFYKVISLLPQYNSFGEFREDLRLRSSGDYDRHIAEYVFIENFAKKHIPDNANIGVILDIDDIIYPYFEANHTWKIHPEKYHKLLKKENFGDYDYLITTDNQTVHVLRDDPIKFNYYRDPDTKILIFSEGEDEPKTLYADLWAKILLEGEGKPAKLSNIIEDKKLAKHYVKIDESFIQTVANSKFFKIYRRTDAQAK